MVKPKIAYILQDFDVGGIPTCLFNIASELHNEFDFHFIATMVKDIHPKFYSIGTPVYIDKWNDLINYLERQNFDIAQVHNLRQYADCAVAAGVPIIIERVAGNRSATNPKEGINWVISSNYGTLPLIAKTCNLSQATTIYNGVDIERINSFTPNRLKFKDNDIIIGRVSRLGNGQNLNMLIKAVIKVNRKYPQVKLVIIGDKSRMPQADDVLAQLKELARPLAESVIFTGRIDQPFDIIKGFNIATCTSNHEGIPNSLLEAMACAKPVVSTKVGQVSELISDGINGLLVPCNDVDALAEALERLVLDKALCDKLGTQAKKTVEEKFNLHLQAGKYAQLYYNLLKDKQRYISYRRYRLKDYLKIVLHILGRMTRHRDLEFIKVVLPRLMKRIRDRLVPCGKSTVSRWHEDLCEYYNVTPLQAEELSQRNPGRRPNLPGSSTTHPVFSMTLEQIWDMKPRKSIKDIQEFYKDMGAWATFRQCYYHRKLNAASLVRRLKDGSRILEYGSGVAPITNWIIENVKGRYFELTIADVDSEHLNFAQWRLNKKLKEYNLPFYLEVITINGDNPPLKDYYDAIFILEVFEHLPNPYEVIQHLTSNLRKGGFLYENYIICKPERENLVQAQLERSLVFDYIRKQFLLVKGSDPKRYPGHLRCWRKL